jgi:hypothetical protein
MLLPFRVGWTGNAAQHSLHSPFIANATMLSATNAHPHPASGVDCAIEVFRERRGPVAVQTPSKRVRALNQSSDPRRERKALPFPETYGRLCLRIFRRWLEDPDRSPTAILCVAEDVGERCPFGLFAPSPAPDRTSDRRRQVAVRQIVSSTDRIGSRTTFGPVPPRRLLTPQRKVDATVQLDASCQKRLVAKSNVSGSNAALMGTL